MLVGNEEARGRTPEPAPRHCRQPVLSRRASLDRRERGEINSLPELPLLFGRIAHGCEQCKREILICGLDAHVEEQCPQIRDVSSGIGVAQYTQGPAEPVPAETNAARRYQEGYERIATLEEHA